MTQAKAIKVAVNELHKLRHGCECFRRTRTCPVCREACEAIDVLEAIPVMEKRN